MGKVLDADNIRYTRRHEWVQWEDGTATVGITDYAQGEIPGVNTIELPAEGSELNAGDEAAILESPDESLSVTAPLDGVVTETNSLLEDNPGLVNADPYGDGWLFRLDAADAAPWQDFMTAEEYEKYIGLS